MAQAKYLDAAEDLRCLQGTGEFATLENLKMGQKEFADLLRESYRIDTLIKARQILDMEQDMQTLNEKDPIGTTLQYGEMTREWLERQEPSHKMVTPDKNKELTQSAEKVEKDAEAEAELAKDIAGFLGKDLPDDPNIRLLMWQELSVLQKKLKTVEMAMRKQMAGEFFAQPKEGTNTYDMGKDWKLKLKHKLNRTPDEAMFETVIAELNELNQGVVSKDDFFKFKPELKKKEYNKLSDKQRTIFDQCLIIKPGSPELELVPPKEKK